jgi:hypothetical protein
MANSLVLGQLFVTRGKKGHSMTDDLDAAQLRLDRAEERLAASKVKYLDVINAARQDFEEAKAAHEAALQHMWAVAARVRRAAS